MGRVDFGRLGVSVDEHEKSWRSGIAKVGGAGTGEEGRAEGGLSRAPAAKAATVGWPIGTAEALPFQVNLSRRLCFLSRLMGFLSPFSG